MAVYWIQPGALPLVKIGWAAENAEARRIQLQAGCWEELRILRLFDAGTLATEAWLHARFRAEWLRGDWFNLIPEMLTIEPPAGVQCLVATPTADLINRLGGPAVVARATGQPPNNVVYWCKRSRIPPEHWRTIVDLAKEQKVESVTHAYLLTLHRPRKPRSDKGSSSVTPPLDCAAA